MAEQTIDPRLETLLRQVLTAEAARLPVTARPDRILERAQAHRRARARSRLRLMVFGDPTSGARQLSVAMAAIVVLAVAGALALATLRLDRTPVAGPLPTTAALLPTTVDAWSRVAIDGVADGGIDSLVTTPRGLIARGEGDAGRWLSSSPDGRTWTTVSADAFRALDNPAFGVGGAAVAGDDQRFLMVGREAWASENGIDWSPVATPADDPELGQGAVIAVAAAGPGFVAVGARNMAWYSTDGSDWALADVPPPPGEPGSLVSPLHPTEPQGTVEMEGIAVSGPTLLAWGKSIWVHEDGSATFVPVLWTSTDGRSWANQESPDAVWTYPQVIGGPNGFLMVGEFGPSWLSADGASWERVTAVRSEPPGSPPATFGQAIAAGPAGYVAAGGLVDPQDDTCAFFACPPEEATVWSSPDGRTWTRLPSDERFGGDSSDQHAGAGVVAAWGDRFVIGGSYGDGPAIWVSD